MVILSDFDDITTDCQIILYGVKSSRDIFFSTYSKNTLYCLKTAKYFQSRVTLHLPCNK